MDLYLDIQAMKQLGKGFRGIEGKLRFERVRVELVPAQIRSILGEALPHERELIVNLVTFTRF